jgi:AraC family transcriptional regulator
MVDFIEQNKLDEIKEETLSKIANLPYYQLNTVFIAITGMGIREYIRLRRLSEATRLLTLTQDKIIDIALECGYSNPESFTRAFKAIHKISPSEARSGIHNVKYMPKFEFTISLKGTRPLHYRFIHNEEMYFVGKVFTFQGNHRDFSMEKELWNTFVEDGSYDLIQKYSESHTIAGVLFDIDSKNLTYSYLIGVRTEQPVDIEGFQSLSIQHTSFVCFDRYGVIPKEITEFKQKIFLDWVLNNDVPLDENIEIEQYIEDDTSPENSVFSYLISIQQESDERR